MVQCAWREWRQFIFFDCFPRFSNQTATHRCGLTPPPAYRLGVGFGARLEPALGLGQRHPLRRQVARQRRFLRLRAKVRGRRVRAVAAALAPRLGLEALHFFDQQSVFPPRRAALLLEPASPRSLRRGVLAQAVRFPHELRVVVLRKEVSDDGWG